MTKEIDVPPSKVPWKMTLDTKPLEWIADDELVSSPQVGASAQGHSCVEDRKGRKSIAMMARKPVLRGRTSTLYADVDECTARR